MSAKKSAFGTWFEQQAGKPPKTSIPDALKRVQDLRYGLEVARNELKKCTDYALQKQFALYAWCAREARPVTAAGNGGKRLSPRARGFEQHGQDFTITHHDKSP